MPLMLWGATLCFSLGALVVLLGLAIFRSDPGQRLNRVAALMISCGGLGVLQVALDLSWQALPSKTPPAATEIALYAQLAWQFFFPALLMFVLLFPQESRWMKRIPMLGWLIFAPYVFHLILMVLAVRSSGTFFLGSAGRAASGFWGAGFHTLQLLLRLLVEAHVLLFALVNLAYVFTTLALLVSGRRSSRSPRLRDQLRAITLGLGTCLVLYSVADPLPNIFKIVALKTDWRQILQVLALLVGSGSIAYAIVRHKFLEAGFILRRSIVFLLPALLIVMVSLGVMEIARTLFAKWFDVRLVQPLILLLAISMLQPLVSRFEDLVEGLLQRDRRDGRIVLQGLSRDIVTILDLDVLSKKLIGSLGDSLAVERCALLRRDGTGFVALAAYDSERRVFVGDRLAGETDVEACASMMPIASLSGGPQHTRELLESDAWGDAEAALEFQRVARMLSLDVFVPVHHGGEVLGVMVIGRKLTGGRFSREDLGLLGALANQTGAAMRNASLYAESLQRAAMEEELNLARQIQFNYLPSRFPQLEHVEVFGLNESSKQVGGDYFDVVELEGSVLTAIADVAGKGVPAALVMSMIQASLRTQADEGRTAADMLARINALMLQSGASGKFATVFLGRLDLGTLEFHYTNAGHNPPLLLRADGREEWLNEGGLLLGVFEDARLGEGRVWLEEGDRLVLYTDGLSEARNPFGDFYDEEGLQRALASAPRGLSARELAEHIREDVRTFCGGGELEDDMTVVVVSVPVRSAAKVAGGKGDLALAGAKV